MGFLMKFQKIPHVSDISYQNFSPDSHSMNNRKFNKNEFFAFTQSMNTVTCKLSVVSIRAALPFSF